MVLAAAGPVNAPALATIRVLLVDDDPAYAIIVQRLLQRSPRTEFRLDTVSTFEAAVTTDIERYDAVLLDYHLDAHTGFEVLRAWRSRTDETPVIMLSASASEAVDLKAAETGAADYLDKVDLDARVLERAVRYAIAMHGATRRAREMARRQAALAGAARAMLEATDASALAAAVVRLAVEEFGAGGAWLGEALPDGRVQPLAAYPHLPEHVARVPVRWDDTPAGRGPTGCAIRDAAPVVQVTVDDSQRYELWKDLAMARGIACSAAFPLCGPEGVLGALNVYSTHKGFFTPSVVSVLATHAHLAALALRGLRFQEQLGRAQRLEAMGRLAGGLAQDFNNLLTAIIGHASLLAEEPLGADQRASVEEIKHAGERATTLTRQLAAFARRQVMHPEVVDVNTMVATLEPVLRKLLPDQVRVTITAHATVPRIHVDRAQLEQALVNLALHACDAMPHGGRLTVTTRTVEVTDPMAAHEGVVVPGQHVVLAISDTGQGLDQAALARVFDPFVRPRGLRRSTGLGLSTVLGIVQQSGGRITVESQPGLGTTFRIYVPVMAPR